ncbi:hypothetical protein LY76DRAFT_605536 [Colletotrichum caudatum]|nr:hypothetical protein LY76DRAFT_605536 [Colletotrichum caudatum]
MSSSLVCLQGVLAIPGNLLCLPKREDMRQQQLGCRSHRGTLWLELGGPCYASLDSKSISSVERLPPSKETGESREFDREGSSQAPQHMIPTEPSEVEDDVEVGNSDGRSMEWAEEEKRSEARREAIGDDGGRGMEMRFGNVQFNVSKSKAKLHEKGEPQLLIAAIQFSPVQAWKERAIAEPR